MLLHVHVRVRVHVHVHVRVHVRATCTVAASLLLVAHLGEHARRATGDARLLLQPGE